LEKPSTERIPHYLDDNQVPQPYSQEKLDEIRVEGDYPYRNIFDSLVLDA
jgi:hypothetical protein